jgi:hypothetical protein
MQHIDGELSPSELKLKLYELAKQEHPEKKQLLWTLNPIRLEWATDDVIMFVSKVYKIKFFVWEPALNRKDYKWTEISSQMAGDSDPCYISANGTHFNYLIPRLRFPWRAS